MENRYLCKQCRHVFDLPASTSSLSGKKMLCPQCGGSDVMPAPEWAPLGSGWNIFEGNTWEYECPQCKHLFELPIPGSPSEENNRKCPVCNSDHLHRLTNIAALPLHCG